MSGTKLWLVVTAITLGTSLVLLDMSIIATVSPLRYSEWLEEKLKSLTDGLFLGHPANHHRISHTVRRGMVWQCIPPGQVSSVVHRHSGH